MSTSAISSLPITDTSAAASTASKSSAGATGASSLASQNVFLQLLIAQLKNQDPQNPADGTQFVTQLAQFTTLEQTTQSRNDLDQILAALKPAAAPGAAATATTATPQS